MAPARWALLPLLPVTKALLNCSEAHDPVTAVCCTAQDAWDGLVAEGGCGGSGPTENQCNAAMELCRDCQRAVQDFSIAEDSDVAVDLSSAKVTCELPQWTPCGGTVRGLGVGLLIATGVALLLVASAACVAFDWRLLPSLVAKQRRKLLVEDIHAQDKGEVLEPEGRADSAPAPPRPVPPAPPTPTARPPQGFDGLRAAADGDAPAESPAMAAMSPQDQIIGAGEPETVKAPPRPRHYASAYALHKAFMVIACIAVVLRVSYIVARVLLVVGLSLAYQCLPELLLCILPLVWVACTSRRPKSSTIAIPASVAYWGPWGALPRFTTYAVCTICTEIYSTLVAALAVARMPCNSSPLAGVLLYCIGLLVAVVRAYCAVLALRLQDELASMCRRVLPREKAAWGNAGNTKAMDQNQKRWQGLGFFGSREVIEDTVRDFNEPDDPSKAALACPFLPEFLCPVLRRRLVGRRILAGGILLGVLSAGASAFIARAVLGEQQPEEERLSSCDATQNGTSTCAAWELAGVNVTDAAGVRKMDLARTLTDCCQGCDEVKDCQGWIFEHLDKRCRWIHFVDEVCNANPGDMSCRCFTSRGIAFSFKPPKKTYLIWVDASWE